MKRSGGIVLVVAAAAALGACRSGDVAGNAARLGLGGASGRAGDIVAAGVTSAVDLAEQQRIQFSPEQEYYLGRGVSANVIAQYGLDPDEGVQQYVRTVGATLVTLAGRIRGTHGGYHFGVLASPQVNGISGPGGFVFVTRGALDAAESEDEIAAILAHEIAHVAGSHGEKVIRADAGVREEFGAIGRIVGAAAGDGQTSVRMYSLFKMAAGGLAKRLSNQGYGAEFERKADTEAVYTLFAAGYDASALSTYLKRLPKKNNPAWTAHPDNLARAAAIEPLVATWGGRHDPAGVAPRAARFAAALHRGSVASASAN